MKKQAYIFIGNSGSGKGTQARLLQEKIESKERNVFYAETGSLFRDFLQKSGYTTEQAKKIGDAGGLQPEFLSVAMWGNSFIDYLMPQKDLITDGFPRTSREAKVLDGALRFYEYENPTVFYLKLPKEVALERMMSRARTDDEKDKIEKRISWFEDCVQKAIDFLQSDGYYNFVELDGTESVESIHGHVMRHTTINNK